MKKLDYFTALFILVFKSFSLFISYLFLVIEWVMNIKQDGRKDRSLAGELR